MLSSGRIYTNGLHWFWVVSGTLLPAYVQELLNVKGVEDKRPSLKIHDTSYLDGLRGIVALLVLVRHFALPWQPDLDYGYLHGEGHTGLLRIPVLRLLYAGPNVPVMLIVSGFVLSLKPFKLGQAGQWDNLYQASASSVFRRAVRLFLPPIISTFLVALAVQAGLFNFPYGSLPGKAPPHPLHKPELVSQFVDWLHFVFQDLTNPWTWKSPEALYGAHLWTTPLQFRCSMVLLLLLVCFSRVRVKMRRSLSVLMLAYTFGMGRWDVALYINGMIMADVYILSKRISDCLPDARIERPTSVGGRLSWLIARISVLFLGLYFASFPRQLAGVGAPGYQWAYSLSHNYRIWHAFGAILLVWSLTVFKGAQSFFNARLAQYLGKLSFSLYIVHEPLLHIYGIRCVELAWRLTGNTTQWRYQLGFVLGFAMTLPVVLWAADVFHRLVDQPCAKLSIWLEKLSIRKV